MIYSRDTVFVADLSVPAGHRGGGPVEI